MLSIDGVATLARAFPCAASRSEVRINLYPEDDFDHCELQEDCARDDHEELVRRYTQGQCGVLATCLHQLLGWPVYGIYGYSKGYVSEGWPELGIPPRSFPPQWCLNAPAHVIVRNPRTELYTDATGAELTWHEVTRPYRMNPHPMRVRIRPMERVDYFLRSPEAYSVCLLDHIPRLFPGLVP